MSTPNSIRQLLDSMTAFVAAAEKVETSDISYFDKLDKLEKLSEVYGLA